ncbi:ergosterol biosynthesis ERG4/ERG24 family-domain-containing protein [Stachybotrys elegans]|uniref:7-dehydrocholesterol reductase n=1 Tax=Stachybotrys elegans TaxID=80388 RepID=A0A8K0SH30_9HYPO|nr:ergosterol biosynthesis ERG4/ERG24 family-domain-containing protein [Stachybotrys elegans]
MAQDAEGHAAFSLATTASTLAKHRDDTAAHRRAGFSALSSNGDIWGRAGIGRSWLQSLVAASPVVLAPLASVSIFITLARFDGSLSEFAAAAAREGFWNLLALYGPKLTYKGLVAMVYWVGLQAVLYKYLPGETAVGQYTPAGYLLSYRINGLQAWIITHLLYAGLSFFGIIDPGFIPRNWSSLVAAMNLAGFVVSGLALVKAYVMPTHPEDRKFSGSSLYDFYMGIELNPRLGNGFDLKLFTNGRPGMMAWTLVDLSNMAYQYQKQGYIEPSLILMTILQTIYVLDFFVNESWYLRTIDIAHDHYGFYLAWGCFCFLPTTYTIQGQYMGLYPTSANSLYLGLVFAVGLAGYALFRSVNYQKDAVRMSGGKCLIWGKPAEYIVATYKTSDGKEHSSLLLCSGWWGFSRHANYVGDLFLSYSMCALVGSTNVVVWLYAFWMTVLLVHRCKRDEKRCSTKYGAAWGEYCKRVPWRFIPGIW